MVDKNLITFEYINNVKDFFFTYRHYKLDLTSDGENYLINTSTNKDNLPIYLVKVGEKVFGEITGIIENADKNSAIVQFTFKYANITPFGDAFSYKAQVMSNELILPYYRNGETFNEEITIVKYDDGWRIE